MTVAELQEHVRNLTRDEKVRFHTWLNEHLAREARMDFGPGDKAKFTSREGVIITGTVLRVARKSVKLTANMDRYGCATTRPVTWTVSPQLLSPA